MITLTSYMSDGIKYYNVKRGKLYTLFGVYLNVKGEKGNQSGFLLK